MKRRLIFSASVVCLLIMDSSCVVHAVGKNGSDDRWETALQDIRPMYADSKTGSSEKKMDEMLLKHRIKEEGGREVVVAKIIKSAWNYYNSSYPNIAMRKFNQAWLLDSKNAEIYFGFGHVLSHKKQFDEAINMYAKAMDLNPKYFEAYASRGLDYYSKAAYDEAILDYTRAIEIKPTEGRTYNDRAVAYFSKKDYNKCWDDIHRAQELGYKVHPEFLKHLQKASGREK